MSANRQESADWRVVYRDLRDQIDRSDLAAGSRLPTIAGLASKTGLTQYGARRVLERLRDEGRSQSWQGLGYRVAEDIIDYRIDGFPRWGKSLSGMGLTNTSRMIGARAVGAPRDLAHHMKIKTGTKVYQSEVLRLVDRRPVALARGHFPMDRFKGILEEIGTTGSVTAALAKFGVREYRRASTQIEARLPTHHEALVLEIPCSQPVIVSTGVNTDPNGLVVEVALAVSRADCIRFRF